MPEHRCTILVQMSVIGACPEELKFQIDGLQRDIDYMPIRQGRYNPQKSAGRQSGWDTAG